MSFSTRKGEAPASFRCLDAVSRGKASSPGPERQVDQRRMPAHRKAGQCRRPNRAVAGFPWPAQMPSAFRSGLDGPDMPTQASACTCGGIIVGSMKRKLSSHLPRTSASVSARAKSPPIATAAIMPKKDVVSVLTAADQTPRLENERECLARQDRGNARADKPRQRQHAETRDEGDDKRKQPAGLAVRFGKGMRH